MNELPDQPAFFITSSVFENREWRVQIITKPSETAEETVYYACHSSIDDLQKLFLKTWQKKAKGVDGQNECIELVVESFSAGNLNIKKYKTGCSAFEVGLILLCDAELSFDSSSSLLLTRRYHL